MAKKKNKEKDENGFAETTPARTKKERNLAYEAEIARLQVEIAHLQGWVKETGARIILVLGAATPPARAA